MLYRYKSATDKKCLNRHFFVNFHQVVQLYTSSVYHGKIIISNKSKRKSGTPCNCYDNRVWQQSRAHKTLDTKKILSFLIRIQC